MKTATRQTELLSLGQWLQRDIQSKDPHLPPLQIQCAVKQGHLLLLVQHALESVSDPQRVCTLLAQSLLKRVKFLIAITGMQDQVSVKIYLRSLTQSQPYSAQSFILPLSGRSPLLPPAPVQPLESPLVGTDDGWDGETSDNGTGFPSDGLSLDPLATDIEPADGTLEAGSGEGPGSASPLPDQSQESLEETVAAIRAIAQSHTTEDHTTKDKEDVPSPEVTTLPGRSNWLSRVPTSALIFSAVAGLLTTISGIYLLTRPCVLSACKPLQAALQMSQEADQLIRPNATADDIKTAYTRLAEARRLLDTVPPWSGYHGQAQALMQQYGERSQVVRQVVFALQQANFAAQKSQNPPHALSRWREVQQHWREAIVNLDRVPPNSPIAPFVREKRQEYQRNLAAIDQRILKEKDAQDHITRARSRAELAQSTESGAKTAQDWRTVATHWEEAIAQLEQIPQGTVGYAEAQQLFALYQPKLLTASDRHRQESLAAESYQEALQEAEEARQSETQDQWSDAVQHWKEAVEQIQRVPDGTLVSNQAQPLVATYRDALSRAQKQLTQVQALQAAEAEIKLACVGTTPFCTYTRGSQGLEIRFTSEYDWAVERVIANVPVADDPTTHRAMKDFIDDRLRSFSRIAEKHQIRLDLFTAYGHNFSRYDPELSGYVAP